MNSVVEDISNMLSNESALGLTFNGNLFLYREPPLPDNTVSVFEAPGMAPDYTLDADSDHKVYERPSIQVRIRNKDAQLGFQQAYAIMNVLQGKAQETWGEYLYSVIYAVTSPGMLDWDASNRVRIVLNFNIQRRLI